MTPEEAVDRSTGEELGSGLTLQERPLTDLEMLQLMIEQGAPLLAIKHQRERCGLPAEERPEPKIVLRTVVAAPRRRRQTRAAKPASTQDPVAQAKGRFDLLEFEETDNA